MKNAGERRVGSCSRMFGLFHDKHNKQCRKKLLVLKICKDKSNPRFLYLCKIASTCVFQSSTVLNSTKYLEANIVVLLHAGWLVFHHSYLIMMCLRRRPHCRSRCSTLMFCWGLIIYSDYNFNATAIILQCFLKWLSCADITLCLRKQTGILPGPGTSAAFPWLKSRRKYDMTAQRSHNIWYVSDLGPFTKVDRVGFEMQFVLFRQS